MTWQPHDLTANFSFPLEELKVLELWKEIDAFKTSLKLNEDKPVYSFYDGPPFATGLPHYGHILAGTIKDTVTRYAHATGHSVERRFGWDTHGLPVEHEIDKKLGIRGREDVLKMGIERYNAECRAIVMRYASEWRQTVERVGRWIDFDNDYKTLNVSYMESVWWVFKQLWEKNLVYCGLRVMPYSTACTTPLANFEASLNYKDVHDPAVTVALELVDDSETSLLIWTTTPWTLPSNLAVCVHPDFDYVKIHDSDRKANFILLEKRLTILYKNPAADAKKGKYKILQKMKGSELKGLKYKPLFPYFESKYRTRGFVVVADKYVTDESGTGLVHQAPAFGDDDHRIAIANGIVREDEMPPCPIDDAGRYTDEVPDYKGQYVKDADENIMKDLKARGQLIVKASLLHSYPFCWRSDTPLIYRAIPVWFVRVKDHIQALVKSNQTTHWTPSSIRDGRFGNWLENARDWNISRNRYWGTPIPIWVSEDMEEMVAVGSLDELNELSNCGRMTDIHRESIDHITIPSRKGKGQLRRVDEVFDCWFESGSMPYAQQHYPFENQERFKASFPADFVCEGLDQTRGWFYTLTVIGTLLYGQSPYRNLICTGIVLAEDGKKMSKRLKNYPDPNVIVELYGADAVRLFLVNSPVTRADNLRFRGDGVKEVVSRVLLPWLNCFKFFLAQVNLLLKEKGKEFKASTKAEKSDNVMDRWILATCQSLIKTVKVEMAEYRLFNVIPRLLRLIEDLTNWYIRFNRKRLKGDYGLEDTMAALNTLFEVLYTLCRTMAPFTPFLAENIYQTLRLYTPKSENVVDDRSIHFISFPEANEAYLDPIIERQVTRMQSVIELGRVVRERFTRSLKTPLKELVVLHASQEYLDDVDSLRPYIMEELNIRNLSLTTDEAKWNVRYKADADWSTLGKRLRKDIQKVKGALPNLTTAEIKEYQRSGQMNVAGIPLVEGDLVISRYIEDHDKKEGADPANGYNHNTDNDVLVFLDTTLYPELQDERLAREIINIYQKLRKDAGLQTTDDAEVSYTFPAISNGAGGDHSDDLTPSAFEALLERQNDYILKTTKIPLRPASTRPKDHIVLREQTREIDGLAICLSVVKLS